tara:strand:+ start:586 stop:855 length:270 start_codon:yes stop_codon:yes gene_type:complete
MDKYKSKDDPLPLKKLKKLPKSTFSLGIISSNHICVFFKKFENNLPKTGQVGDIIQPGGKKRKRTKKNKRKRKNKKTKRKRRTIRKKNK